MRRARLSTITVLQTLLLKDKQFSALQQPSRSSLIKKMILSAVIPLTFAQVYGIERKDGNDIDLPRQTMSIRGAHFSLKYQVFESHDQDGTQIDTVSHKGDYIFFALNGNAYMRYKGRTDSITYNLPDEKSVSFGDTPFIIANLGNGYYKLFQNEEEPNGDYNRVTYLLKREAAM